MRCFYLYRIGFFLSVLFFNTFLSADWNYHFLEKEGARQKVNAPAFLQLEHAVIAHLENSWCSEEKARLLMELTLLEKPSICVEIGVFTGSTLLPVAATLKYLQKGKVYAIDPWSNEEAIKNCSELDPNIAWWQTLDMKAVFRSFLQMHRKWRLKSFCEVLKQPSKEVASIFEATSIDFLHIDGNYSEEGSLEDVALFLPKVRSGGYVLYSNFPWVVNGIQTRREALQKLLDSCEIVSIIDDRSSFLLRKF